MRGPLISLREVPRKPSSEAETDGDRQITRCTERRRIRLASNTFFKEFTSSSAYTAICLPAPLPDRRKTSSLPCTTPHAIAPPPASPDPDVVTPQTQEERERTASRPAMGHSPDRSTERMIPHAGPARPMNRASRAGGLVPHGRTAFLSSSLRLRFRCLVTAAALQVLQLLCRFRPLHQQLDPGPIIKSSAPLKTTRKLQQSAPLLPARSRSSLVADLGAAPVAALRVVADLGVRLHAEPLSVFMECVRDAAFA